MEPMFAPAVVIASAGVPHRGGPAFGVATPPIRVEISGGTQISIKAAAPAVLVVADYDPYVIEELPMKYALGRIAARRNAAKARINK